MPLRKIAIFLMIAVTGCSQQTSTFSGKVTVQGKSVTSGVIFFIGPEPELRQGMGTIQDDGTYTATDIPVGEVHVTIQSPSVPPQYANPKTSGLVFTITPNQTKLDIIAH